MKVAGDYFSKYSFNGSRSSTALNSAIVDILFRFIVCEGHSLNVMKIKSEWLRVYRGELLQALTMRRARFIDAIAARIFPTTDTPGAVEAGAVFYIDRALAGPYSHLLSRYTRGLRAL